MFDYFSTLCMKGVVDVWATWATFQPKLEKYKKIRNIHSEKISCSFPKSKKFSYFGKSNFLALRLKKILYFFKKSFSYISGNGTF